MFVQMKIGLVLKTSQRFRRRRRRCFYLWCDTSRIGDPLLWEFNSYLKPKHFFTSTWMFFLLFLILTFKDDLKRFTDHSCSPDLFWYFFSLHHHLPHIIKIRITFFFCFRMLMCKKVGGEKSEAVKKTKHKSRFMQSSWVESKSGRMNQEEDFWAKQEKI